ncbi:hypothetical protein [Aromatoleum buckelii]|uniref:Uncharacterized protein n=1 Tax=Aromatoleum buckelii TaxID=200254 RepID=A0ABX1N0I2_9RHOO|nr:hypothetical protein [Aromatoleum buckelii]MCK0512203.1 hypothetical protein [Aromatoleum buckelii]
MQNIDKRTDTMSLIFSACRKHIFFMSEKLGRGRGRTVGTHPFDRVVSGEFIAANRWNSERE